LRWVLVISVLFIIVVSVVGKGLIGGVVFVASIFIAAQILNIFAGYLEKRKEIR